jgi:nucleoside-diphosphate-sugar epimerase
MIVLAGVTGTDTATLALNTDLALAAVAAARQAGIGRILIASSQAVYGPAQPLVSEATPCQPVSPYGRAKLQMEQALAGAEGVTLLRLGNVAGADSLLLTASRQAPVLDRFADGQSPRRSYIGPVTLARVLNRLLDPALDLPPVLNVASPGLVAMNDLLLAARQPFTWTEAPPSALPRLELDVSRLAALVPLDPARAGVLVDEARQGGWSPRG